MFAILILNILLLIYVAISRKKWMWVVLYVYEAVFFALSAAKCSYYNGLPGSGKAPGLAYFGDVMYYFFSCVGFVVIFVVTLIVCAILHNRARKQRL